ncbi:hypothetical protein HYPSUDRAFT_55122 [Hypholoma sublateritium FD-334 SS-4]|uniref:Uncharacterized protein n=1 Tax=Hypholoma sublateritium (strain FD-334 SS-4) TaxID=945553 RepID=A0A0D2NZT8_HYPSF|nr:hypothetical protein HYPSUDRAFT_55122 [Hypholoma sublateritium FD-334 SS-4]
MTPERCNTPSKVEDHEAEMGQTSQSVATSTSVRAARNTNLISTPHSAVFTAQIPRTTSRGRGKQAKRRAGGRTETPQVRPRMGVMRPSCPLSTRPPRPRAITLSTNASTSPSVGSPARSILRIPDEEAANIEIPAVARAPPTRSPSLEILEDRTVTQSVYFNQNGVGIVGEPRPTNKSRRRKNQINHRNSSSEILTGTSAVEIPTVPRRSPSLEILEEKTIYRIESTCPAQPR